MYESHAAPAPPPSEDVEAAAELTPTPGTSDSLVMLIAVLGLLSVGSAVVLVWNPRQEG